MPDWKPATNNGKAVASYYNLPVTFDAGTPGKSKKQLRKEARALRKNGNFSSSCICAVYLLTTKAEGT